VVERGSGEGGGEASAIDQVGGLYVECTRPVGDGGGEVASYVFASEQPQAISLLLPLIQQDLDLRIEDVESIFERFGATEPGSLVDLGVDGPGAVAPIDVADAASAVLYVSAAEGGASPAQVRTIAQHILDGL
jgi:hypothetical protein